MQEATIDEKTSPRRLTINVVVLAVWVMLAIAGHVLIAHYGDEDELRALRLWEQRLTMVAHNHAEQIAALLAHKVDAVRAIADNVSVQLYLSTIASTPTEGAEAEVTFLRNYVLAVATQSGLVHADVDADAINANINLEADAGLAIVTPDAAPVVSTRYFPAGSFNKDALLIADASGPTMLDPDKDNGRMWVSVPIRGVQAEPTDAPVGYVIATFKPLPAIDGVLAKGELPDSPAASRLVAGVGAGVALLAPTDLLQQTVQSAQYESVAVQTHRQPNQLIEGRNEAGVRAFAYAKAVDLTGWSVVRQVTRDAALKEVAARAKQLLIAYWLAVAVVTMTAIALWRHVTVSRLGIVLQSLSQHEQLL